MSASRPDEAQTHQGPPHRPSPALSRPLSAPKDHTGPTTALATLGRSARALERLEGWLAGRTLEDGALADYLAQLFDAGQVVAAVRLRAKLAGTTSPAGPATARGQVAGVRWDQADLAAALADRGSLAGLRVEQHEICPGLDTNPVRTGAIAQ